MTYSIVEHILNLIFPQTPFVRSLHNSSGALFLERIGGYSINEQYDCTALISYKNPLVKKLIHSLKYSRNTDAVRICVDLLHDYLLEYASDISIFTTNTPAIITTIPMSRKREVQRGDNHMHRVLKALEKQLSHSFEYDYKSLVKTSETPQQSKSKSREERARNIRNSFDVIDFHPFNQRHVVVIDDVATTGSTLNEIKGVLIEAGAKDVHLLAIAH